MMIRFCLLLIQTTRAYRYLVLRHGETNYNADGIIQGSSDFSRLSDKGIEQAKFVGSALAERIADGSFPSVRRVLCSPLTRAQQTLELMRESLPELPEATVLSDLREVDLHSWEGRSKAELLVAYPEAYEDWKALPLRFTVDGHMPIVELWGRASRVWRDYIRHDAFTPYDERRAEFPELADEDGILLVCHNAVGQALLSTACGGDSTDFRKHELSNCAIAEIEWPSDMTRATRWCCRLPETRYAESEWHMV